MVGAPNSMLCVQSAFASLWVTGLVVARSRQRDRERGPAPENSIDQARTNWTTGRYARIQSFPVFALLGYRVTYSRNQQSHMRLILRLSPVLSFPNGAKQDG